jgi:hypothetical protein
MVAFHNSTGKMPTIPFRFLVWSTNHNLINTQPASPEENINEYISTLIDQLSDQHLIYPHYLSVV